MSECDYEELMQAPPGGENHGYGHVSEQEGWVPLSIAAHQAAEFMRDGGFGIVSVATGSGGRRTLGPGDAGMTARRADAYIDRERLQALVEQGLGFTLEQLGAAYGPGRPTAERLELRGRIDARLLEIQRKGGNMLALARALGWPIREEKGECRVMAAALARARAAEASTPDHFEGHLAANIAGGRA